ncbi:type 1 glutamine amidotransferase domain-containing protein [Streptoalloteichus hindustanus]|uniref:Protease I n=1 Tax=Streptoalloteichus hindustanus TaxID=2017 RepID=A0A1M4U0U0_STRHI|nr:type 1 glutamine amidotransferase domain-containing protein [Streptoalloteichus hindustanus]SHE50217.1 protease I [Streptoalloteichus hindustanus]
MAEQTRIAFLVSHEGIEQVELTDPWQAVRDAGGTPQLLATVPDKVQAVHHLDPGDEFEVDLPVAEADPGVYDGLVIPGGTANADALRQSEDAVRFVRAFVDARKPVAAICHGPWALVEADAVRGKRLTSYASLATDIRNAGGEWVDEEVVVCDADGWTLVTSRKPDDLDAFDREALRAFGLSG